MNKFSSYLKKKRFWIVLILVLGGLAFWFFSRDEGLTFETQEVVLGDVLQTVIETGLTEAADEVVLQFEQTGRVAEILVSEGDIVSAGQALVRLESSGQYADLLSAEAGLRVAKADLAELLANSNNGGEASSSLGTTKQQQEVIIQNAYSKLLSEGLVAEPASNSNTQTAPVISGRYVGGEGTYKMIVRRGNQFDNYNLNVFDLETVRDVEISKTGPTKLGTRGLYVTFPDDLEDYNDTIWYVQIPNTKSSSYLANYNAYISAKEGANVTLVQTGATAENIQASQARVEQAEAQVASANSTLSKRTLRAPFDGVVTRVDSSVGEIVSAGQTVASLISNDNFEIKLDIPEADIANVEVGDRALVTFDAYDDEEFEAEVLFIAPAARLVDGVPSFETTLRFVENNEKIKSGLSADVEILAAEKKNVLAVPSRALFVRGGKTFVRVVSGENFEEREVRTGLRGSLGLVEVMQGLNEGEEVITFISEDDLEKIENKEN